jgi:Ca-activated chloride channel family protein
MEFLWPSAFGLLLIIPVIAFVYWRAQRERRQIAARYANLSLMRDVVSHAPGKRRHISAVLFLLALTVMIVALARPVTIVNVASFERTVILAIDISGSMRAEDLKPNRIEAAKAAARSFVEKQETGTRVGIVSFSGGAALVQPPTADKEAVIAAINRLTTQRATAIGSGILASLDAIAEALNQDLPSAQAQVTPSSARPSTSRQPAPTPMPKGSYIPAIIVLLTDGQNTTGPLPLDAAQIAVQRGIRVYTIGIGTAQGTTLPPPPGGFGGGGGGAPPGGGGFGGGGGGGGGFRVQLDESTLRQIAKLTDAKYYYAANSEDLRSVYEALDKQLVVKPQQTEITAYFTAFAVAFALIGCLLSLVWFRRLP